jgi:hypothetical protein
VEDRGRRGGGGGRGPGPVDIKGAGRPAATRGRSRRSHEPATERPEILLGRLGEPESTESYGRSLARLVWVETVEGGGDYCKPGRTGRRLGADQDVLLEEFEPKVSLSHWL